MQNPQCPEDDILLPKGKSEPDTALKEGRYSESRKKSTKRQRSIELSRSKQLKKENAPAKALRLMTQQYRSARHHKFRQAQHSKDSIEIIRQNVVQESIRRLERKHSRQRAIMTQAHHEQMQQLQDFYNMVVRKHQQRSNKWFTEWKKRQHKESIMLERSIEQIKLPPKSVREKSLKKIQQYLVEKELYSQADRIENDIRKEKRQYRKEREMEFQQRANRCRTNLQHKQRKGYYALIDRIRHSSQERHQKYEKQREKLEKRYSNIMSLLYRQQSQEIQRLNQSAQMLRKYMDYSCRSVDWIIKHQRI